VLVEALVRPEDSLGQQQLAMTLMGEKFEFFPKQTQVWTLGRVPLRKSFVF
jgi:hypothetical protein